MNISAQERARLKGEGFLLNNDGEHFNGRIITVNGVISAEQMAVVSEAARRFGDGHVAMTVRLTLEVTGLTLETIEPFKAFIAQAGLVTGGTGAKVRPVVACKGTVCVFGLIDTQAMAEEVHRRFYEGYRSVALPHKFKIAVGGCPNNCVKPDLNDMGIVGQRVPAFDLEACRGCKKCTLADACPMGALSVVDGKLLLDAEKCNNCGRCYRKCPFKAGEQGEVRYKLYVGGRWGKQTRHGDALSALYTYDEALEMVEKCILLYKKLGEKGERFGSMIDRLGLEQVEAALAGDGLLAEKQTILGEG